MRLQPLLLRLQASAAAASPVNAVPPVASYRRSRCHGCCYRRSPALLAAGRELAAGAAAAATAAPAAVSSVPMELQVPAVLTLQHHVLVRHTLLAAGRT